MSQYEPRSSGSVNETHRYFPEWADRPTGPEPQHEADRNSYLAGGYADEFGYGTEPGRLPAIAPLDGDPERSRLWSEQIGALHPGYPQCPKPCDRLLEPTGSRAPGEQDRGEPRKGLAARTLRRPVPAKVVFRIIRVRSPDQALLRHRALGYGVFAFLAERLIRRRHLNDVL